MGSWLVMIIRTQLTTMFGGGWNLQPAQWTAQIALMFRLQAMLMLMLMSLDRNMDHFLRSSWCQIRSPRGSRIPTKKAFSGPTGDLKLISVAMAGLVARWFWLDTRGFLCLLYGLRPTPPSTCESTLTPAASWHQCYGFIWCTPKSQAVPCSIIVFMNSPH